MLSYSDAVKSYYANAYNFKGRATRAEFWWSILHFYSILIILAIIDLRTELFNFEKQFRAVLFACICVVFILSFLSRIIPVGALIVRRLHDVGLGRWWLVVLYVISWISTTTCCISIGIFFILMLLPGSKKDNKYGASPYIEDIKENETDKK